MFDISKISSQQPWALNISFNSRIDFCVWVLLNCGVQIPPFKHHNSVHQSLLSLSLDAASWYTWLLLVVATQDGRLNWHIPDIEAEVSRQTERTKQLMQQYWSHLVQNNEISDPSRIFDSQAPQLNQYLHWQEEQYQQALKSIGSSSKDALPAMIYPGEQQVKEQLESLWSVYQATPKDTNRLEDLDIIGSFYQELKQQFSSKLSTLRVYLVHYPAPIFFPVAPVSILVSEAKDLSFEDLRNGLFHAAETLLTS
ncbi:hypothetical protein LC593_30195 [Nostoc sp. CHAB 5844]|nr:hypothetical protein [Nostoc sp. CHAB 5844]